MQKIISLFKRDYDGTRLIYDEVVPGAEWVQAGEGVATVKWDGTSCLVKDGVLYRRYDAKHGKTPPEGFMPAQEPDVVTGHWPGWVRVRADDPASRWHIEAIKGGVPADGTYELLGPKIQCNPYHFEWHYLERHGETTMPQAPRTFEAIKAYLTEYPDFEGIVWHHPDGRMAKVKRKDFGLAWPVK